MTLEQSQCHQTYDKNVDSEQRYSDAKFKRSRFNSVREKGDFKVFFFQTRKYANFLPWKCSKTKTKKTSGICTIYMT